jgi:hypothetical protein
MKTKRTAYRLREDDLALIKRLGVAWGGIKPLSDTDVIREALRRAVADVQRRAAPKKSAEGS